jgi:hypothetical protein
MDNAITLIDKARADGALTFASQNLECPPLYKVEASVINVAPKDFHDKEVNGKLLPRKEIVDKIGDAAGISFIQLNNEHSIDRMEAEPALDLPARSVFVANAQGKVRLSDGSWRTSTVETYAFDYVARATAEEPTDAFKRKKKMQEYYKAGPMRAASGARLRVIRQLTGMPNGFAPEEIKACQGKLVFSRIVQNTDFILSTHEGRMMAIAMATGAANLLYGPKPAEASAPSAGHEPEGEPAMRTAEEQETTPSGTSPADLAAQAASSELDRAADDGFGELPLGTTKPAAEDEKRKGLIATLRNYLNGDKLNDTAAKTTRELLDNPETKTETLEQYVALIRDGRGLKVKAAS